SRVYADTAAARGLVRGDDRVDGVDSGGCVHVDASTVGGHVPDDLRVGQIDGCRGLDVNTAAIANCLDVSGLVFGHGRVEHADSREAVRKQAAAEVMGSTVSNRQVP